MSEYLVIDWVSLCMTAALICGEHWPVSESPDSPFTNTVSSLTVFRVVRAIQESGEDEQNFDEPNQNDNDEKYKCEIAKQIESFRHHSLVQLENIFGSSQHFKCN